MTFITQDKTNWKFLLIILILSTIAGGGILYYSDNVRKEIFPAFQQILHIEKIMQDPTVDWKTYTNLEFKYQISYPKTFEIKPQTAREKSQLGESQRCITKIGKNFCKLLLNTFTLSSYKLVDHAGGFIFRYEKAKEQWVHDESNEMSQFVPQRASSSLEAYFYKTGDVKCGTEYILIPDISSDRLIEINNITCRDDWGNIAEGYGQIDSEYILSTFRFLDDNSQISTTTFSEFCKARNGFIKFSSSLNFDEDGANEVLVMCAESGWDQVELPGMGLLDIYVLKDINNNYQTIWARNTANDFNLRGVGKPEIIDIDKDGINEILISGSNWGGTCTGSTDLLYIYSPKHSQFFSLLLSNKFDDSCEKLINLPPEFSQNLESERYKIFKNYLEVRVESLAHYIGVSENNIIDRVDSPDFKKVAYIANMGKELKGFIYNSETKKNEEINSWDIINIGGAISSSLDRFSPKGRFLYFNTGGETEYMLQTVYDIEKKSIFVPVPYGTLENLRNIGYAGGYLPFGENEEYMIFLMNQQGDCLIENTIPAPGCHFDTIIIQNLNTGKTKTIATSNRKYGYTLKEIRGDDLLVEKYWIETAGYKSAEEIIKNIYQYLP